MKYILSFILIFSFTAFAQFDIDLEKKLIKKGDKEFNDAADDVIDKGVDAVKKGAEGEPEEKDKGDKDQEDKKDPTNIPDVNNKNKEPDSQTGTAPNIKSDKNVSKLKAWSKFDFFPGKDIIFEDDLLNEQHGEFPSKWDLVGGNAENTMFGNEIVIGFMSNRTQIIPLMKTEEYLPEVFTIEFDIYFYNKYNEAYYLNLKNLKQIDIRTLRVTMGSFSGVPDASSTETGWHHIALSFNIRALKVYFDQTRVLNIPNIKKRPTAVMFSALSHGGTKRDPAMIRNIRIAEGGVDLYDKLMTDGKIVTTGIRFNVNKATIKPQSMGVLNTIAKLLKEHKDIRFSVEGHTDGDGDDASNQKLSEARANSVKNALVEMGIDASRLETKGFGESNPVSDNTTPEGKANNRRVEFVKI